VLSPEGCAVKIYGADKGRKEKSDLDIERSTEPATRREKRVKTEKEDGQSFSPREKSRRHRSRGEKSVPETLLKTKRRGRS